MIIKKLDKICDSLFAFFVASNEKIGFNELLRSLNGLGVKVSKPTLSEHLKHLTEQKILTRKEEGKQRVYYEINWELFENLRDAQKENKTLESYLKNKKVVQSFPLDEQLRYVANVLALRNMHELRLSVLSILEPDRVFDYSLESLMSERYFQSFKDWLLENCQENKEEFRKKALPAIEANIERLRNDLFDQKPTS